MMYTPMCADDYMKAWEAVNPEYREAAIVFHMDTLSNKLNRLCNELDKVLSAAYVSEWGICDYCS